MAIIFLIVLALVFALVWTYLGRRPHPPAKLGPDGTNVREPETFVVHHEGKGQGIDIANTALKQRTEHPRKDLPGEAGKIKAPIPGRDLVQMEAPPSDISKYGSEKVAPGTVSGSEKVAHGPAPGRVESKETVLTQGPEGSRPSTPEEPGSPHAKGRRVTDTHRDVELAAEVLPSLSPGHRMSNRQAVSPSTNGQEPGYGLGRTAPGETDGEGGYGQNPQRVIGVGREGDWGPSVEGAEYSDEFGTAGEGAGVPEDGDESITFQTAPTLTGELPVPDAYGEDRVIALVRNPRSLYVYWEPAGFGDENLREMLGEEAWRRSRPVLRVYDLDSGAYPGQVGGRKLTVQVGEHDDHWFIQEGIQPGNRYIVAYERETADGDVYLLSHSHPVQMPQDGPAGSNPLYQLYGGTAWAGSPGGWATSPAGPATSPWR
jgi:hypothetical protein